MIFVILKFILQPSFNHSLINCIQVLTLLYGNLKNFINFLIYINFI